MTNSIEVKDLTLSFGSVSVLKNMNLDVEEGEFVVLLGPSGCGKSTLLNCLAGLLDITDGQIWIKGKNVTWSEPSERGIGMVFQSYALWPHLDVAGNVGYALRVRGLPAAERASRVATALETVGLAGFQPRRVQDLSGGQRQRVALARCLAMQPRLLLLDEPLANLDAHLREAMVEELRHLHRATGTTILYVTHDQAEALAMADRIAVMAQGRILQMDTPERVWREPASEPVARFLGRGEVVPVEVLDPGPPARVRLFGAVLSLRAPQGLRPGPALACLRRETLVLGPEGLPVRVLASRAVGARQIVTVSPLAAPDCRLTVERDRPGPLGETACLALTDGWVLAQEGGG